VPRKDGLDAEQSSDGAAARPSSGIEAGVPRIDDVVDVPSGDDEAGMPMVDDVAGVPKGDDNACF
jgi:hypothetical protein